MQALDTAQVFHAAEPSHAEEASEIALLFSRPCEDLWDDAFLHECISYLTSDKISLNLPASWPARWRELAGLVAESSNP
jgi:hypothetical protein